MCACAIGKGRQQDRCICSVRGYRSERAKRAHSLYNICIHVAYTIVLTVCIEDRTLEWHGIMCSYRETVRGLLKSQVTQLKQPHPSLLRHHPKSPLLHFQRNWTLWTVPQRTSSVPWPLNFSSSLTWHFAVATTSPRELWLDWRARESHAPFAKSPTWPQYWTNSTDAGCGQFKFAVPTLLEGVSGRRRWGSWVSTFRLVSGSTQKHQYHDSNDYYYYYCVCEYCIKFCYAHDVHYNLL
jgi:hypothetical protein